MTDLSEAEWEALQWLRSCGGSVLASQVPDRNERGDFGQVVPGMGVYRKLVKKGLVTITEEDGDFTPAIELTQQGRELEGKG